MNAVIERDPRVLPQPGDAVQVGNETREVVRTERGQVVYGWPDRYALRSLPLGAWKAWAAQGSAVECSVRE